MLPRPLLAALALLAAACGNKGSEGAASAKPSAPLPPPAKSGLTVKMLDVPGPLPPGVRKHQRVVGYTATTDVLTPGEPFCKLKQLEVECPPTTVCDPPTPLDVLCGPAAKAPAGKEGWYRSRLGFQGARTGCVFTGDALCPPPGKVDAACTPAEMIALECTSEKLESGGYKVSVPAFEYVDADGTCKRFPAFSCTLGACTAAQLPEPTPCQGAPSPAPSAAPSAAASK